MTDSNVLGLIPARGGSEGIPGKNLRELDGVPLIEYSIRAGLESSAVDSVVVSTDDEEIAEVAASSGARIPFLRPPELARDETPTPPVITHALQALQDRGEEYKTFILLQPTSPLRSATHIDEAFSIYDETGADTVISAYPSCVDRWQRRDEGAEKINFVGASKRRQDRDPEFVVNGAIYVTNVDQFMQTRETITGIVRLYEMSEWESVDIDTPFDLWAARKIIKDWIS